MRLGIDLDGVVADFNTGWVSRYNHEFGSELTTDLVDSWNTMGHLTHFESMGAFWRWAARGDHGSVFRHLETYPDALETLERLAGNHDIVIISAKPDWAIHDTFAWIANRRCPPAKCTSPTRSGGCPVTSTSTTRHGRSLNSTPIVRRLSPADSYDRGTIPCLVSMMFIHGTSLRTSSTNPGADRFGFRPPCSEYHCIAGKDASASTQSQETK